MPQPTSNLQRLLTHLKNDSLAHKLVSAAIDVAPGVDASASLKEVLASRVQESRSKFDDGKV
jgi:hypothetical protein